MAKFVAAKVVERIEWDFSGVPHVNAGDDDRVPETVQGDHVKGVLREPDADTAARFAEAYTDLVAGALEARQATIERFVQAQGGGDDVDPKTAAAEVMSTAAAYTAQHDQAIAALRILDVPAELLEQLPPRHVAAFLTYVEGELTGEGDAA